MEQPLFPNYMQMRQQLPVSVWQVLSAGMVACALALIALLFVDPHLGLVAWWLFVLPVLPLLWVLAPGIWRNVCPMAALNQYPRLFGFTRGRTVPPWLRRNAFAFQVVAYFALVSIRAPLFDHNGPALAGLMVAALGLAFLGGVVFKGKSGWCGTFCPLLPIQRLYGQTPFVAVPNAHCRPCVGCTKNCYDFNPRVAAIADANDDDPGYIGQRKLFAGAFPGFVVAFFTVAQSPIGHSAHLGISVPAFYATTGLYMLISLGAFFLLDALALVSPVLLMAAFGALGLNLHNILRFPTAFDFAKPTWLIGIEYTAVALVTVAFLYRTYGQERRFTEEAAAPAAVRLGAAAEGVLDEAVHGSRPEVTILPDERRIAAVRGSTLLEIVEKHGLPIEAGCRMGMCGSDPVCVVSGGEHLSPVGAEERTTLERLGLAENVRMACSARIAGPVSISLTPQHAELSVVGGDDGDSDADPSIRHVVVIGNGIAGVTAADHVRRRHRGCELDLVARERYHLYNRMAITRLIYGRSAMQSLFLMDEQWYEQHRITTWLNTRVVSIDREQQRIHLGTGESLPYDRLILTAGSSNFVPPIEGFGVPGSFVLREAEDAMRIRAFVQERRCRRAVVAGGGLLGLEAAYALKKLELHVTVLEINDRLLHRQLDERAAQLLLRYLEGLGIEVLLGAHTERVESVDGHVRGVRLTDGSELEAELFLLSAGIAPNVEIAREAGLQVGRGVLVDDRMRTSDPIIFAAGDVAEAAGSVAGLWPTAVEQAQIAAANAVGGDEIYTGTLPVTMLKVTGVELTSIGRFEPDGPDDEVIAFEDTAESRYRKLVVADGNVVGGILLGYALEAPGIVRAVKEGRNVTRWLEELRAGDWSAFVDEPQPAAVA
jgi:nitrite reductase (NADH) large subunit